jgi:hypothetical protein
MKRRATRYAYPISIAGLLALGFLYYSFTSPPAAAWLDVSPGKPQLYTRDAAGRRHSNPFRPADHEERKPERKDRKDRAKPAKPAKLAKPADMNGVSFLTQNDDELIAEDDLFWQAYKEPTAPTAEEEAAAQEIKAHKIDVQQRNKAHVLQSLVWWLAEGGVLPAAFEVPTRDDMLKRGGRGLEKALEAVDVRTDAAEIFQAGWADYTQKQYRIVVFSKVSSFPKTFRNMLMIVILSILQARKENLGSLQPQTRTFRYRTRPKM